MSYYSQNIDNNQRLAAAAATSMGHNEDDARYMANSMTNPTSSRSLYRDQSLKNAWARDLSNGAYGYDDQSTQDYLDQASQYGVDPPSRQTMEAYRQSMYPQYGNGAYRKHTSGKTRRNKRRKVSRRKVSRKVRVPTQLYGGAVKSRKSRRKVSRKSRPNLTRKRKSKMHRRTKRKGIV